MQRRRDIERGESKQAREIKRNKDSKRAREKERVSQFVCMHVRLGET